MFTVVHFNYVVSDYYVRCPLPEFIVCLLHVVTTYTPSTALE